MASREYTPEQLRAMQQEAAARVREMQRRARARLEGHSDSAKQEPASVDTQSQWTGQHESSSTPPPIPTLSPPVPPHPSQTSQNSGAQQTAVPTMQNGFAPAVSPLSGLFGLLGNDSDRLTLLLLMLLLSADGQCSPSLMAALFWLMTP